ncbi:uncharacterized protein LOC141798208 isoform X2 [Halichoeres trimaculatus]|uniref:uncharacterized protein LOC141798208 isoform X2 n=1 Tax=Halichoeres trimaculatus TaxID=147232 RepID=UPI003D9F9E63
MFVWTSTTPSSKLISKRPATVRVLEGVSENMQRKISDVSSGYHTEPTRQSVVRYGIDLVNDKHNPLSAEGEGKETVKTQTEETKETQGVLKLKGTERTAHDRKLENKSKVLFLSDKLEDRGKDTTVTSGVQITENTDQGEEETNKREINTNTEESTMRKKSVTLRQNKSLRPWEVKGEDSAERKGVTQIILLLTKDAVKNQREYLTMEGAKKIADGKDLKHKNETGQEGRTNVPLEPNTSPLDVNNDKGRGVTSLPSCYSLIGQLGATEHKVIQLSENTAQMKSKPLSYKTTSSYARHSALMSQSPKISGMTSFPKETFTDIKPHPSPRLAVLTNHVSVSSLTKESAQKKASKLIFSMTAKPQAAHKIAPTFGVSTTSVSPRSSTHPSAPSDLNRSMLSINASSLRLTPSSLQAQPHFSVNTSILSASIIQRILWEKQKFSTLGLKKTLLSQTTDERVQADHITQATSNEASAKSPLSSALIEGVNESTSVTPPLFEQLQNDSSTRIPTVAALSDSIHGLHLHRGRPVTQLPLPFFFDMITGQPCSCNLTEQDTHVDTWQAFVDDNKHRSVQAQMSSVSPKTRNNQFSFSSTSLLLNPMLLGSDSSTRTLSLTGLTTSASGRDADHGNERSGSVQTLVGAGVETNQAVEDSSVQTMVTLDVKQSDVSTKKRTENRENKYGYPFVVQPTGWYKHHRSNSDESDSWPVKQTEKPGVKHTNEKNHNDLRTVEAKREMAALENNHPFQLEGYNEMTATPFTLANQTTQKMEQTISEDLEPVLSDSTTAVVDPTGNTSNNVPEIPKVQTNDVSNRTISESRHPAGRHIEKGHDPATPQDSVVDEAFQPPYRNFRSDLKIPIIATQQIANQIMADTSEFQITSTKTNDFVSVTQAHRKSGLILSPEACESALTASEKGPAVTEESPDRLLQPNNQTKLKTALEKQNITEPRNVEQPEREISIQDIKQSQHALLGTIEITSPINNPQQGAQAEFLSRAGEATTKVKIGISFFLKRNFEATSAAFDAKHLPHGGPHVDTRVKHKNASPTEISISSIAVDVPADPVSPMGIMLKEMNNKTRCGATGCTKLSEMSKTTTQAGEMYHLAQEEIYEAQVAYMGRDNLSASETQSKGLASPECSTDCSVPGKTTPQIDIAIRASQSSAVISSYDRTFIDETMTPNVSSLNSETSTSRAAVENHYLDGQGTLGQSEIVEKTTQRHSHRETSETAEVTVSEPGATSEKAIEQTLLTGKNTKAHLKRRARADLYEKSTKPEDSLLRGVTTFTEFKHRLLLPEKASESELRRLEQRRQRPAHLCLFGLAAEPAGITLLPTSLPTSASFTISLFQMINYSVVYLHCDLSVCPRNRSDCERCLQQRSVYPFEEPEAAFTNIRNRISFGPVLKEEKNSTFPEELDPSELDLVLVIISLVVGSSVVTVSLLLVWLAYRHRAIRLLPSAAAPPPACCCCCCLHPGDDLILP